MDAAQSSAMRKLKKCMALANDARGDPTTRETALRQAAALMAKLDQQLDELPLRTGPAMPTPCSPAWAPYWAQRTVAEAQRAGVKTPTLCSDAWFIPG